MEMTGISVAKVARIELTGRGTDEELDLYRGALKGVLGDVLVGSDPTAHDGDGDGPATTPRTPATSSPALTGIGSDGSVRTTEWNGLTRGDHVRVQGLDGQFKFLYHHVDDHQEYVELSGPLTRYRDQIVGRQQRSIRPERIIIPRSKQKR
jgi:hypothetical protein